MKKYLVGGAVRDQLLNFPFSEKDWVVVGSTPEKMIALGYRPVGKDFPVFLHPETGEEYALARTERKTAPGYKGFTFHTDPSVTLEEDLERRDLTINAIAQDDNGELFDPYDGQNDIDQRTLRHISLAFAEDPVRVLRVARFSARYHHLGFTVALQTLDLMYAMAAQGETKHLVAERVWQELAKALHEKNPQQFFIILKLTNALIDILPEINTDHYKTSIELLSTIAGINNNAQLRFAALCYPLAAQEIQTLCQRLGTPNDYRDSALLLNQYAQPLITWTEHYNDRSTDKKMTASEQSTTDSYSPKNIATALQRLDVNRKQERFSLLVEGAADLFYKKNKKRMILFWENALQHYLDVSPQTLIEQGYEKSELGEAIFQQRIEKLSAFLSSNTDKKSTQHE